jgi:pimeloyl-ACP methyl ester carboxylesterase
VAQSLAGPVVEHSFRIFGADRTIPATFVRPSGKEQIGFLPVVLMLHGTASNRNEVGDMFARQAVALSERGIASLRIDFAGCGDSDSPQTDFTVSSELSDARAAFAWLVASPEVDERRITVLGFSQGGMIAVLLAGGEPAVAGLIAWSSGLTPGREDLAAFSGGFDSEQTEAKVDLGFATFTFSRVWWQEFSTLNLTPALARYRGPTLAIAGSRDVIVSPKASLALIAAAGSDDKMFIALPNADHTFNTLTATLAYSDNVIITTADWVRDRSSRP